MFAMRNEENYPLISLLPLLMIWSTAIHLTLKGPITTAADNIHKYFFIVFQSK